MVYEYLLQFTEDPYVKETLRFLMTREVAHFQMFEAALATIQPNFPPGILQSDPRYSNLYFNMSSGNDFRGPWNKGLSTQLGETFQFIEDPVKHVMATNGLLTQTAEGTDRTEKEVQSLNEELSELRSEEITSACSLGEQQWNDPEAELEDQTRILSTNGNAIPGEDASITAKEKKQKVKQSGDAKSRK
jgi:Mn-containing catalase